MPTTSQTTWNLYQTGHPCPCALDWSAYIKYVVRVLEKKPDSEVKRRVEEVRELVKGIVHCDITQDPPIEPGYEGSYDVVVCSLVMEGTDEEYYANIARFGRLVKPGGKVI